MMHIAGQPTGQPRRVARFRNSLCGGLTGRQTVPANRATETDFGICIRLPRPRPPLAGWLASQQATGNARPVGRLPGRPTGQPGNGNARPAGQLPISLVGQPAYRAPTGRLADRATGDEFVDLPGAVRLAGWLNVLLQTFLPVHGCQVAWLVGWLSQSDSQPGNHGGGPDPG